MNGVTIIGTGHYVPGDPVPNDALARVMPEANVLKVSAKSGEGIDAWLAWLEGQRPAPGAKTAEGHHHHDHEHTHEHH